MTIYGFVSALAVLCFKAGLLRSGEIKFKHESLSSLIQQIKIVLSEKYWVFGGILAVAGWIVYLIALSFFEISIVKPLTNISIIVLIIGAMVVYSEKVGSTEWLGLGALFLASVILSLVASEKPGKNAINQFLLLLTVLTVFILLVPLIISFRLVSKSQNKEKYAVPFALFSGSFYALGGLFTNVMLLYIQEPVVLIGSGVLFLFSYAVAFIASQVSIISGRLSIVYTVESTQIILVSVIGGSLVFNESLFAMSDPVGSVINLLFIIIIIFGVFLLRAKVDYRSTVPPSQ
jgi:uncharacterized membrane protein